MNSVWFVLIMTAGLLVSVVVMVAVISLVMLGHDDRRP